MANPTTNYGFVLPTPTDLVTDLPADFDVALQGVDTRLKALQPGTTLGDLAYSSATANTNTRLAIGSTGNILTVAGGVPTWAAPAAAGSLTLLSTTTLSGATTTISSISTAYTNLLILIENSYSGNSIDLGLRFNSDTASNYAYWGTSTINGSLTGRGSLSNTEIILNDSSPSGNQTKNNGYYIIELPRYTVASGGQFFTAQYNARYASGYSGGNFTGTYLKSAAITSISLTAGNSTWTAGTVYIYGVN
jgi:hypothetical protein